MQTSASFGEHPLKSGSRRNMHGSAEIDTAAPGKKTNQK
jgi:hypothetical protein